MRTIKSSAWDSVSKTIMRTIKYRAWDSVSKNMLYMNGALGDIKRFFRVIPDDAVLMQFTGLLDKNGAEIYEGDFINEEWKKDAPTKMVKEASPRVHIAPGITKGEYVYPKHSMMEVKFNDNGWCTGKGEVFHQIDPEIYEFEIMGNIHEGIK